MKKTKKEKDSVELLVTTYCNAKNFPGSLLTLVCSTTGCFMTLF